MKNISDDSIIKFCIKSILNEFEKHMNPTKNRYIVVENEKMIKSFSSLFDCLEYIRGKKITCEIQTDQYDDINNNIIHKYTTIMKINFTITPEKICECCKKASIKYHKQCILDIPILNDDSLNTKYHELHKLIHTILMERRPITLVNRFFHDIYDIYEKNQED